MEPQLTHEATLSIAGKSFGLRTNSEQLSMFLSRTYWGEQAESNVSDAIVDIRVDEVDEKSELPIPYFRGSEHLVFATFGPRTFFTFDLLRNQVSGVIPARRVHEPAFWRRIIVPIMLGVLGPSVGVAPLHCACLSNDSGGIMITGTSGAGKSTLSVALAQCGLGIVSDDWTYVTQMKSGLTAFGLSVPVKLLPDSTRFFPELRPFTPAPSLNGELAYEVNAADAFFVTQKGACRPTRLFLLQRRNVGGCQFRQLSAREVYDWLDQSAERLPKRLSAVQSRRSTILHAVSQLECFGFDTGLSPHDSALALKDFCESH